MPIHPNIFRGQMPRIFKRYPISALIICIANNKAINPTVMGKFVFTSFAALVNNSNVSIKASIKLFTSLVSAEARPAGYVCFR